MSNRQQQVDLDLVDDLVVVDLRTTITVRGLCVSVPPIMARC